MDDEELIQKKAEEVNERLLNSALSTEAVNRDDVAKKIEKLYALAGWDSPVVIWCESPLQLTIMAALAEIISGMNSVSARNKLRQKLSQLPWERALGMLELQLSAKELERIARGRKASLLEMLRNRYSWLLEPAGLPALGKYWSNQRLLRPQFSSRPLGSRLGRNGNPNAVKEQVLRTVARSVNLRVDRPVFFMERAGREVKGTLGLEFAKLADGSLDSIIQGRSYIIDFLLHAFFIRSCANEMNTLLAVVLGNVRFSPLDSDLEAIFEALANGTTGGESGSARYFLELELANSVFAYSVFKNACFVCERPTSLTTDDRSRLHNPTGPAIGFLDGFSLYAWHGIVVDDSLILRPESITIKQIENEENVEVRRIMIDRFGFDRYVVLSGAEIVDVDDVGYLYRKPIPGDEPLVMVEVTNSTAEPDGSFKRYFLRVPPDTLSAREAVAWTFGMDLAEYCPAVET